MTGADTTARESSASAVLFDQWCSEGGVACHVFGATSRAWLAVLSSNPDQWEVGKTRLGTSHMPSIDVVTALRRARTADASEAHDTELRLVRRERVQ